MLLHLRVAFLASITSGVYGASEIPNMVLFPPHRVSSLAPVELWVALPPSECSSTCHATVTIRSVFGGEGTNRSYPISCRTKTPWGRVRAAKLDLSAFPTGSLIIVAEVVATGTADSRQAHVVLARRRWTYELVHTGVRSTRLLDGAFIDIVHWSGSEGAPFNDALRRMSVADWVGQIADMAAAGIRTAVVQAVFINNQYPGGGTTCDTYPGVPLYPSRTYSRDKANFSAAGGGRIDAKAATEFADTSDKLEAILAAADAHDVSVFIGLGNFAWFTFTPEALCWTKRVATEIWLRYAARHRSLYGWYLAGEMDGALSLGGPDRRQTVTDLSDFVQKFRQFATQQLEPVGGINDTSPPRVPSLLPVMLAINSDRVMQYAHTPAGGWSRILSHLDVLAAFGFSRIPGTLPWV